MKRIFNISILLLCYTVATGQINRKDIVGDWETNNHDSLYYKADTILLYNSLNHLFPKETCNIVKWSISKRSFKIENVSICSEAGLISEHTNEEKLQLYKSDFGRIIKLKRNEMPFDKFKIVELNERRINVFPYEIKELKLIMFDNIYQQKLYKHVDSLIFKVLRYDSTFIDSSYIRSLGNEDLKSLKTRKRIGFEPNPNPRIIINGNIIKNKNILKEIRWVEVLYIKLLESDLAMHKYGFQGQNGAIEIKVPEKTFSKVWKKYERY